MQPNQSFVRKLWDYDEIEFLSKQELLDLWEAASSRKASLDFTNCERFFEEWRVRHDEDWKDNEQVKKIMKAWMGIDI